MNLVLSLYKSVRPLQWLKNLSVFAALIFAGGLFDMQYFAVVFKVFVVFCGLSSATYLMNDVADRKKDQAHPLKKNRPIAKGELHPSLALSAAFGIVVLIMPIAYGVDKFLLILSLGYMLLQVFYSMVLRNVIILDAMAVAMGFIFRVYAGALAIDAPISSWLIVTTIGLSLVLAFGKRRSEVTLLASHKISVETRKTLKHYPVGLLDAMISINASIALLSYMIFTFQISPIRSALSSTGLLPTTLLTPKWMMLTIPIVIYIIARYLYVVYEKKEGESPAQVMLTDMPLLGGICLWVISVIAILYYLSPITFIPQ